MIIFVPTGASAYIGPGLGLGAVGVILGIFLAALLAFFAILWYPIKRLFKKSPKKKKSIPEDQEDHESGSE